MVAFRLNFSSYLFFFPPFQGSVVDLGVLPSVYCLHSSCSLCFLSVLPLFFIDLQCFIPRVPQFIFNRGYFLSAGMKRPGERLRISLRLTRALYAWAACRLSSVWTKTLQSFEPWPHSQHCRPAATAVIVRLHRSAARIDQGGDALCFYISSMRTAALVKDGHWTSHRFTSVCSLLSRRPSPHYGSLHCPLCHTEPWPLHMCQLVSWHTHTPVISFSGSSLYQSLEVNIGRRSPPLWVGQEVLFHTVAPAPVFVLCHHSFSLQAVFKPPGKKKTRCTLHSH